MDQEPRDRPVATKPRALRLRLSGRVHHHEQSVAAIPLLAEPVTVGGRILPLHSDHATASVQHLSKGPKRSELLRSQWWFPAEIVTSSNFLQEPETFEVACELIAFFITVR